MAEKLDGVELINITQVPTEGKGNLQFFEGKHDIDFEIKRIYYISDVKAGIWRGSHAHKKLKQLLFCPCGSVMLKLSDGTNEVNYKLDNPCKGVVISKPIWRDMYWEVDNSVLCVAASDYYQVEDYIRDYDEFIEYLENNK